MMNSLKKIVITGVTGFIGSALAKRLLCEGVIVYGVGRNFEKLNSLCVHGDFRPIVADFDDYEKLDTLIKERNFDHFYHFAWRGTSTNDYNDYNVQIHNIKSACDAITAMVRLGCSSSSCISSYQVADTSLHEMKAFNPVYYGIIKRCAGELFKAIAFKNRIPCVNLIFPNTYGANDKTNTAIVFFIKNLLQNKPLNLISGDYPDDWMFVEDIVDGVIMASQSPLKYGAYYVGHRNITTFKEKLTEMKHILKSSSELHWGEYPENYYVDYGRFDLDALYHDTGWEAKTDFSKSILETAEWVKKLLEKSSNVKDM